MMQGTERGKVCDVSGIRFVVCVFQSRHSATCAHPEGNFAVCTLYVSNLVIA